MARRRLQVVGLVHGGSHRALKLLGTPFDRAQHLGSEGQVGRVLLVWEPLRVFQ